jgi:hypothetical protein
MSKTYSLLAVFPLILASSFAQTTWNDGGVDASWSNFTNWSAGVPTSTSAVTIGTTPTANLITLDTGSPSNTIASLVFSSGIGLAEFTPNSVETLTVTGNIVNQGTSQQKLSVALTAGGTATWTGPIQFANIVSLGTNAVSTSGALQFTGPILNFDITNATTFGRFSGTGTYSFSDTIINFGGAYTGVSGNSFDFSNGSFSGATLGALPTLTAGLSWNTSQFTSLGILSVTGIAIPEPSTAAALGALGVLGFAAMRRRRISA